MSQPHNWPLSHTSNKANGSCSVCLAVPQLHLKDGTIHLHEIRDMIRDQEIKDVQTLINPFLSTQVTQLRPQRHLLWKILHITPRMLHFTIDTDANGLPEYPTLITDIITHHTVYVPSDTSQRLHVPRVQQLLRPYLTMSWLS